MRGRAGRGEEKTPIMNLGGRNSLLGRAHHITPTLNFFAHFRIFFFRRDTDTLMMNYDISFFFDGLT